MEINSVKKTVQFVLTLDLDEAKQLHRMHGELTTEGVWKLLGEGFKGTSESKLASPRFYTLLDAAILSAA